MNAGGPCHAFFPESPATLAPQQALYIRVDYQSDQPLRFQAAGYFHGVEYERITMNASPVYRRERESCWRGWRLNRVRRSTKCAVPVYPVLQVYAFFRLRGPRRLLSALPLSFMLPTYAFCLYALSRDSNLWPLYADFLSPIAIVIVWGTLWYNGRNPAASTN